MGKVKLTYDDGSTAEWIVNDVIKTSSILYSQFGKESELKNPETDRRPAPVVNKNDLAYLFQSKRDDLLFEIEEFKIAVRANTLGDYSEIGFLAKLMQILMED